MVNPVSVGLALLWVATILTVFCKYPPVLGIVTLLVSGVACVMVGVTGNSQLSKLVGVTLGFIALVLAIVYVMQP